MHDKVAEKVAEQGQLDEVAVPPKRHHSLLSEESITNPKFCSNKLTQSYHSESFEPQRDFSSPGAYGSTGPILGMETSLLDTPFELRDNRGSISPSLRFPRHDLISPTAGLECPPPHARITPKGFPLFRSFQDSSSKTQNFVSTSPYHSMWDMGRGPRECQFPWQQATITPDDLSKLDPSYRTCAFESSFGNPTSNVDANRTLWSAYGGSQFAQSIVSNPDQPCGSEGITSTNVGVPASSLSQNTTRADLLGNYKTSIPYSGSSGIVPTFLSEIAYSTPPMKMPCHDVAYENGIQANFRESALHYPTIAPDFYQGKSATNFGFTAVPWPRVMQQDSTPFVAQPLSHFGSSSGNWTGASEFNHKSEFNADRMPRIHACQTQFSSLPSNPRPTNDLNEGFFTPFMTTPRKMESEQQQKYKEDPFYRFEEDSQSRCTSSSVCPNKTTRKTYAECNEPNGPSRSVASSGVAILSASRSTAAEDSHTETKQQNLSSAAVQSDHPRVIENSKLLKSPVPHGPDGLDSKSSPKYRRIKKDSSTSGVDVSSHLDCGAVGSLFSQPSYTESASIPLDKEKHTMATKEKCLVKLVVSTSQRTETSAVGDKSLQVHASTSLSNESKPLEIRPQSSQTRVTACQDQRSKLHKPQSTFPQNDISQLCKSPALRDAGESPATSKYNQDELPKSDIQSRTIPKSSLLVSKKKNRVIAPSIDDDAFSLNVNGKVGTSDAEKCEQNRDILYPRKRPEAKELLEKPNTKFTQFSTEEKRCPSAGSKRSSRGRMSKKKSKNVIGALAKISTAKEPSDEYNVVHSEAENRRSLSIVLDDCQTTSCQKSDEVGENKFQVDIRSSQEQCYPSHLPRPEKQTPTSIE